MSGASGRIQGLRRERAFVDLGRVFDRPDGGCCGTRDMAGPVETSGSIETFAQRADGYVARGSAYSFDEISVGDRVALCFAAGDDAEAPFSLRIRGPNGALILDRILRELPTGLPQSEPPVTFVVSSAGAYQVEIHAKGQRTWGKATMRVR